MGHRTASGPHSRFTSLRVPKRDLLAPPEKGAAVILQSFGPTAALVGVGAVGIMRAAFDAALAWAKRDDRGGSVPVIQRQAVADLLIDVKMRAEASRMLAWKALHYFENGSGDWENKIELLAEAKIFGSDAAVESVVKTMGVVGM